MLNGNKRELKRICVYAASSSQVGETYLAAASELGQILAKNNISVVYGGGSIGLMGALADAVVAEKGTLIGVIPEFMMKLEWGNPHVSQMIITENLAERKAILMKDADAIIVLPGGTGTLEELSEALSFKKLGQLDCPIIMLNTIGFFDPLIAFFDRMVHDRFIRPEHQKLYSVVEHPAHVLDAINQAESWGENAHRLASL
jgi:uncharacterized protein (TIGR00730 family)